MSRDDPQLNVRLPPERREILDAAALVHRKGTAGKLVQQLVEEAIDRYAKSATVRKALEAMHEQDALDEGKLSHLAETRRSQRKSAGDGTAG